MKKLNNKKIKQTLLSVFRQSSIALLGFLFPILILKMTNSKVWGEFFEIFLFTLICSIISNWGNKEYLLLKFSKEPNLLYTHFSNHFIVRLPLLIFCFIISFLIFDSHLAFWINVWLIGRYVSWSFEVVNQFQKDNFTTSIIEYSSFILLISLIFNTKQVDVFHLVQIYGIYQVGKGLAYYAIYHNWLTLNKLKYDFIDINQSFFYFLLAFSGFLISKMDVYIAKMFFTASELGQYAIQNNLFLFAMSIGNMSILPFVKIIYRKNGDYYSKIKNLYALFGLFISIISIVFFYFLNLYYLKLNFNVLFYSIGFLYIIPTYMYGIDVYEKFKNNQEKFVLLVFIISALIMFILNIILLKFNHHLVTLLISATFSQWMIFLLFKLANKSNTN